MVGTVYDKCCMESRKLYNHVASIFHRLSVCIMLNADVVLDTVCYSGAFVLNRSLLTPTSEHLLAASMAFFELPALWARREALLY